MLFKLNFKTPGSETVLLRAPYWGRRIRRLVHLPSRVSTQDLTLQEKSANWTFVSGRAITPQSPMVCSKNGTVRALLRPILDSKALWEGPLVILGRNPVMFLNRALSEPAQGDQTKDQQIQAHRTAFTYTTYRTGPQYSRSLVKKAHAGAELP